MKISVLFAKPQTPKFTVVTGRLGKVTGGKLRWVVEVVESTLEPGAPATRITVRTAKSAFTFFLRDVTAQWPIWIPQFEVVVVPADDRRDYRQITDAIRGRGLQNELDRIAGAPEETFANAAAATRDQPCETWLGLSRDLRMFRVTDRWGYLGEFQAQYAGYGGAMWGTREICGPECEIFVGRGAACRVDIRRWLEDGALPILNAEQRDGEMLYRLTTFVTLERSALTAQNLRGSHFLVADRRCVGHMHQPHEQEFVKAHEAEEFAGKEQTVLLARVEAINTGTAPHYAFLSALAPRDKRQWRFDGARGWGVYDDGKVGSISRLNGKPLRQLEVAVLVAPGEKVTLEAALPHQYLPAERARALARFDFEQRRIECQRFWRAKLATAASIRVPEKRIDEMIRAGLLHLDLVSFGREPDEPVAATIGLYSPIGSESAPIIQFYDSVGWHKLAERSLDYFLAKQHANGFMQNFGGYMLETGGALWTLGEHYRYTRDARWVRRVQPKLLKACEFLLAWRERNQRPELKGKGYGLIEGKCGDPEDPYRSFMLNGYAYLGLQRVSEMLAQINPAQSKRLATAAAAWRADIRAAVDIVVAESPVIPLGDGTWVPTCAPWAEGRGAGALHVDGTPCNTHGTVSARDSLVGPLYLIFQEIVEATESLADFLVKANHELFTLRNAGFSQPYYCRHDYAHLRRGEVPAFLKAYYNQFAAMADRQTYTFWEHYFGGPHKTHEEGWFLMQTRWMLWLEDGNTLRLLAGIPRAWLESGQSIAVENVASYFGPVSFRVESNDEVITAAIECRTNRQPAVIEIRLPHWRGAKARHVEGGTYNPARETVRVAGFKNSARVILKF
ncbi:MAG: hypothetical protein PCFJNLEI_02634 [Verrucomicrobiae bacterium]|nr:hypothetical protein [Verrucomicrobiae bacterium]